MNKKPELWDILFKTEQKITKELKPDRPIPIKNYGHIALSILNKLLNKEEDNKLKNYSDQDIQVAFSTVKNEQFVEKIKETVQNIKDDDIYNKTNIWSMLQKVEVKAVRKLRQKYKLYIEDYGHIALSVLNESMGKPEDFRLKYYTDQELQKVYRTIINSHFLTDVKKAIRLEKQDEMEENEDDNDNDFESNFIISDGPFSPEGEMSILRAQSLVTGKPVVYPKELLDRVRKAKSNIVNKLWDEVESRGGRVHEIEEFGKDHYGFKIATPVATYLTEGSYKDIIELVEKDMRVSEEFVCLSCKASLDICSRNTMGVGQCQKCGALFGSITQNFGETLKNIILSDGGVKGLHKVLLNWDKLYGYDEDTNTSWCFLDKLKDINDTNIKILPITGPSKFNKNDTFTVFKLLDKFDDDEEYRNHYPSCESCKHCIKVEDDRDTVLGYTEHTFHTDRYFCIYPNNYSDFYKNIGIETDFKYEKITHEEEEDIEIHYEYQDENCSVFNSDDFIDYEEIKDDKLRNILFEGFINKLNMTNTDKAPRAMFNNDPKETRNICPKYTFDKNNTEGRSVYDLEETGETVTAKMVEKDKNE